MEEQLRQKFNASFTKEKYDDYIKEVEGPHPGALEFRIAETPIFVNKDFKNKMLAACEDIIDVIVAPNFKELTERSIPAKFKVPNEEGHAQFVVFDFGICETEKGEIVPQLIEMQGFPTLFAFQATHSEVTAKYAELPNNYSSYLNGYNKEKYLEDFKDIVLGDEAIENVILLEVLPEIQKTKIDFYCTQDILGINIVCLSKIYADGDNLYYDNDGVKTQVKRIYNRVIFDDVEQQENFEYSIDLKKAYNVTWVPHPNWFYRISKFTLPFIQNEYVPETFFLDELMQPVDLKDYVLKPLFSFAGMGVVIDVTQEDIDNITDPENWILQKKVHYKAIVETPDEPAKAEIRLFYFWKDDWARPIAVHNLARLSKGKMIGTRYNKDREWVGGTVAFFKED
jgi:hypothetical protein